MLVTVAQQCQEKIMIIRQQEKQGTKFVVFVVTFDNRLCLLFSTIARLRSTAKMYGKMRNLTTVSNAVRTVL